MNGDIFCDYCKQRSHQFCFNEDDFGMSLEYMKGKLFAKCRKCNRGGYLVVRFTDSRMATKERYNNLEREYGSNDFPKEY